VAILETILAAKTLGQGDIERRSIYVELFISISLPLRRCSEIRELFPEFDPAGPGAHLPPDQKSKSEGLLVLIRA
jgi:hypothetical protein